MDVDRYLARIRFGDAAPPDLDTLSKLMLAHLHAVPFENLDIHRGVPIVLDEHRLYRKIVDARRGGFCYELNGLFAVMLEALGFQVTRVSSRVISPDGRIGPDFDHLALLVDLPEGRFLADVGFGEGIRQPMPVVVGAVQTQVGIRRRLEQRGDDIALVQRGRQGNLTGYILSFSPRRLDEFAAMCHYHQTSPDSPFTRTATCSLATAEGRVTLSGDTLTITRGAARIHRPVAADERPVVLRELFDIEL